MAPDGEEGENRDRLQLEAARRMIWMDGGGEERCEGSVGWESEGIRRLRGG